MNMPPFWSMYVAVPKLEDAVAHVKRLGGSELSGVIDVPTVGRMQMLKDPQGAAFYIIQPAPRDERPESAPEVGEASWLELMTTDAAAAMTFYNDVFGWRPTDSVDMGPMGKYQMFNRPHGMIGGMMNRPPEMAAAPPMWTIYFRVPDINEATARIKANGGSITSGPRKCRAATGSSTRSTRRVLTSRCTRRKRDGHPPVNARRGFSTRICLISSFVTPASTSAGIRPVNSVVYGRNSPPPGSPT